MDITRRSMIASLVVSAVAPLDVLLPVEPKRHGIVFDGVDDLISVDVLAKQLQEQTGCFLWIRATVSGFEMWDGERFVNCENVPSITYVSETDRLSRRT